MFSVSCVCRESLGFSPHNPKVVGSNLAGIRLSPDTSLFFLVTGERSKLQDLRWNSEEFLDLHTVLMMAMNGHACIDGYTGKSLDRHMERLTKLMKT
ncbi:MAG: hypothetical protein WCF10_18720 [Polyangiales bacterium]